jgi:ribosomal protein S27E
MVNSEFIKDLQKGITQSPSANQVLEPGSPRRFEPASGLKKHNERIHKESKYATEYKNLPFTFRKPLKPNGRNIYLQCNNCGHIISGSANTVGIICNNCKKFSKVTEVKLNE